MDEAEYTIPDVQHFFAERTPLHHVAVIFWRAFPVLTGDFGHEDNGVSASMSWGKVWFS